VILGVSESGAKRLVGLDLAVSEASVHWSTLVKDLASRSLGVPELVIADGHAGLGKAMELWPQARIQRCTVHKWGNLKEACPSHARRELKRDYDSIVYAKDGVAARKAEQPFLKKWKTLCPAVVRSYEEAKGHLLTFFSFPKPMWKPLRTTNSIENLNRELQRRTKTQASFSSEESALTLLFGLIAFGQIRMRRIDGHQHVAEMIAADALQAAS
jgi:putative transposase